MSPVIGGVGHHYRYCSWTTSNTDGPGYCETHMRICPESFAAGRHARTLIYTYKKTDDGSWDQPCGLCNNLDKIDPNKEKKNREDEEKRRKAYEDKHAMKQMPKKERTKPRHDKSGKAK